jgi:hypothetical protein
MDDPNASGGHFRVNSGQENQHAASLTFTVPTGKKGSVTYFYARSPKGGTANIYLDNSTTPIGTVSYKGGSSQNTTRNTAFGFNSEFGNLPAGSHTLKIVPNGDGVSFVDGFCMKNASPGTQDSATAPGGTMNNTSSIAVGQGVSKLLPLSTGTKALAIMAESANGAPVRITLIDPTGLTVRSIDVSGGVGAISLPAPLVGNYVLKGTNLSGAPVTIWTSVTPLVSR